MKTLVCLALVGCGVQGTSPEAMISVDRPYTEMHRPQVHFSPQSQWLNDPNGLVFFDGEYHLFYQHNPDSNVWGPMHWGHAVSSDLVRWRHLPIALYPDILGTIFSGSAVVDWNNTTGFGKTEIPPMVAIFTHHNHLSRERGDINYQNQSLAYSLDKGRNWQKYDGNPVLDNPGIEDFRDPKVSWHEDFDQWTMVLAVKDHVNIYSSNDLKNWELQSEFGREIGAHGGVWECPDLFKLADDSGAEKWVMLVSINPGGPQGGSATQYFIGDFDGTTFIPDSDAHAWIDYGADNYAGVTFSDIPNEDGRRIFIGWMSNWQYANVVPTINWRNGMTIPRELSLVNSEKGGLLLKSRPVQELSNASKERLTFGVEDAMINLKQDYFSLDIRNIEGELSLSLVNDEEESVNIILRSDSIIVDRTQAGISTFSEVFAATHKAPLFSSKVEKLEVLVDACSIEVFVNDGETVMTELLFPSSPYNTLSVNGRFENGSIAYLHAIW